MKKVGIISATRNLLSRIKNFTEENENICLIVSAVISVMLFALLCIVFWAFNKHPSNVALRRVLFGIYISWIISITKLDHELANWANRQEVEAPMKYYRFIRSSNDN